jgi:hypothetical protein
MIRKSGYRFSEKIMLALMTHAAGISARRRINITAAL